MTKTDSTYTLMTSLLVITASCDNGVKGVNKQLIRTYGIVHVSSA